MGSGLRLVCRFLAPKSPKTDAFYHKQDFARFVSTREIPTTQDASWDGFAADSAVLAAMFAMPGKPRFELTQLTDRSGVDVVLIGATLCHTIPSLKDARGARQGPTARGKVHTKARRNLIAAGLAPRAQMRPSHGGIGAFGTQRGSGQSRGAAADSLALLQVPIG